jgi:Macrocin-O-methyltransferase (TylF)
VSGHPWQLIADLDVCRWDTLVHLGAGDGRDDIARHAPPARRLVLVEGNPSAALELRLRTRQRPWIRVMDCVLAPSTGHAEWYSHSVRSFDGLLPQDRSRGAPYPRLKVIGQRQIQTQSLAHALSSCLDGAMSDACHALVIDIPLTDCEWLGVDAIAILARFRVVVVTGVKRATDVKSAPVALRAALSEAGFAARPPRQASRLALFELDPNAHQWHRQLKQHVAAMSDLRGKVTQLRAERSERVVPLEAEVLRQREVIGDLRAELSALRTAAAEQGKTRTLLTAVRDKRLTYLSMAKLDALARTCLAIEEQRIPGVFIEAGCALGGSSVIIGSTKRPFRRFEIYDVFGMIPSPGEHDPAEVHKRYTDIVQGSATGLGGDRYYGYEDDLETIVRRNLQSFGLAPEEQNITLVRGLVQETLTGTEPVAFAHLDVDWYEPSLVCIERLYPRLSIGGSIIVDDYHDWGGCRRAIDEYLNRLGRGFVVDDSARSLKITKVADAEAHLHEAHRHGEHGSIQPE